MKTRRLIVYNNVNSRTRRDAVLRRRHGVTTVRVDERQRTRTNVVKRHCDELSECGDRPEDAANHHQNGVGLEPGRNAVFKLGGSVRGTDIATLFCLVYVACQVCCLIRISTVNWTRIPMRNADS